MRLHIVRLGKLFKLFKARYVNIGVVQPRGNNNNDDMIMILVLMLLLLLIIIILIIMITIITSVFYGSNFKTPI